MSFDCEGLGFARRALTELAKKPKSNPKNKLSHELISELYVEIREARIAGHGWKAIKDIVVNNTKIEMSTTTLARIFGEIDKRYERETGEKALGAKPEPTKKRGRPAKK